MPGQPAKDVTVAAEALLGAEFSRSYTLLPGQSVTFTLTDCGRALNDVVS